MPISRHEQFEISDSIFDRGRPRHSCVRCGNQEHQSCDCDAFYRLCWWRFSNRADAENVYRAELNLFRNSISRRQSDYSYTHPGPRRPSAPDSPHRPHRASNSAISSRRDSSNRNHHNVSRSRSPRNRFDSDRRDSNPYDEGRRSFTEDRFSRRRPSNRGYHDYDDPRRQGTSNRNYDTDRRTSRSDSTNRGRDRGGIRRSRSGHFPSSDAGQSRSYSSAQDQGAPLEIITNYVKVEGLPARIYAYSLKYYHTEEAHGVSVQTELKKRAHMQRAFETARSNIEQYLRIQNQHWATNFRTLWTFHRSANPPLPRNFTIPSLTVDGGRIFRQLQVCIKHCTELNVSEQDLRITSIDRLTDYIAAANALVNRPVYDETDSGRGAGQGSLTQLGENRFFLNQNLNGMTGLHIRQGYTTSIRPAGKTFLLNINTSSTAFFRKVLVSDFLSTMKSNPVLKLSDREIESMMTGLRLRVNYRRTERRRANGPPMDDINSERSRTKVFKNLGKSIREQTFFDKGNEPQTVYEYYRDCLPGIRLDEEGLCVNVGKKLNNESTSKAQSDAGAIWIPAQLLQILPHQPVKGRLCAHHTSEMIKHANRSPHENKDLIESPGLPKLQPVGTATVCIWGGVHPEKHSLSGQYTSQTTIERALLKIPAKNLIAPTVEYADSSAASIKDASWGLRDDKFSVPAPIKRLNLFVMDGAHFKEKRPFERQIPLAGNLGNEYREQLRDNMVQRLNQHGIERVSAGDIGIGRIAEFEQFLRNHCGKQEAILVALANSDYDTHAAIKRMADLSFGANVVCAVTSKLERYGDNFKEHFLTNYSLKFNLKCGGRNHTIPNATWEELLGKDRESTIVMGADVAHPAVGDPTGSPSVASVVGSVDREFQNYPGSMRLQAGRQEWIEDMRGMVLERLRAYRSASNKCPSAILFYRDGISESMFEECDNREIRAIRHACNDFQKENHNLDLNIRLTFVVVGKRHSTRFYPKDPKDMRSATGNGNLKPGLLVKEVITCSNPSNFFLQSHAAVKGTARSAHYHVLLDEIKFGSNNDKLANLSHQLCYCYPRATKGVSYVAPAYIADRLCDRGRHYLRLWERSNDFNLPRNDPRTGQSWNEDGIKRWRGEMALRLATGE